MLMVRDTGDFIRQMMGESVSSKNSKNKLRDAGIDTNSKAYQVVIKDMESAAGAGVAYTNPVAIRNRMMNYDADGNFKDPVTGFTGLDATGIPMSERHRIIDIAEKSRQEMFDATKRAFMSDKGTGNGKAEYRNDIFRNYQKSVPAADRLKGSWTLGRYEAAYAQAFHDAAKAADPAWKPGKDIPADAIKNVTRESVEKNLVTAQGEYGEVLVTTNQNIPTASH